MLELNKKVTVKMNVNVVFRCPKANTYNCPYLPTFALKIESFIDFLKRDGYC